MRHAGVEKDATVLWCKSAVERQVSAFAVRQLQRIINCECFIIQHGNAVVNALARWFGERDAFWQRHWVDFLEPHADGEFVAFEHSLLDPNSDQLDYWHGHVFSHTIVVTIALIISIAIADILVDARCECVCYVL